MNFFRLSKKSSIILTLTSFLCTILLIFLYVYHSSKPLMVLIIILSLIFAISMNSMVSYLAVYKFKPKPTPKEYYQYKTIDSLSSILLSKGFKETITSYGSYYIKIIGITAYKIILIKNLDKYFNQDQTNNESKKTTKGLEKCQEFIGFEFFYEQNEELLKKLSDFSFTTEKIFYEGFYASEEEGKIVEYNKLNDTVHKESYEKFIEILELIKF